MKLIKGLKIVDSKCMLPMEVEPGQVPPKEEADILSNDSKREYIKLLRKRYKNTESRREKGQIISEYCLTFSCHRKHALRVLNNNSWKEWPQGSLSREHRRARRYNHLVVHWLKKLYVEMGYMCSKKMAASMPTWLPYYPAPGLTAAVKEQLMRMSPATIDRLLRPHRAKIGRARRSGTRRGYRPKYIMQKIPLVDSSYRPTRAGFVQADTVSHCGGNLTGNYAWSLTVTDVYSGWTENRAVWNKLGADTVKAIESIMRTLPFGIEKFNVDNGSEFLNEHFAEFFGLDRDNDIATRSRAYKKNDNCFVEQKNFTTVREIFGYDRLDHPDVVKDMNELYRNELSLLHNYFIPQMKMTEKSREGARYKRKYGKPQTPYQVLMASNDVPETIKAKLQTVFQTLDPFELRRCAQMKLKLLIKENVDYPERKAA